MALAITPDAQESCLILFQAVTECNRFIGILDRLPIDLLNHEALS